MSENNSEDKEKNLKRQIVVDELSSRFVFLSAADNAVEAKAGVLLGFEAVIAFTYWADYFFLLSGRKVVIGLIGVSLLLISVYFLIKNILWPQSYGNSVVKKDTITSYLNLSHKDMLEKFIVGKENINSSNAEILKLKVRAFKNAIILFVSAMMLLMLSVSPSICL